MVYGKREGDFGALILQFYLSLVFSIMGAFLIKILLVLVGYEMIIANSALRASLAIYHLISNARSWNNCLLV